MNITIRITMLTAFAGFAVSVLLGYYLLPLLRRMRFVTSGAESSGFDGNVPVGGIIIPLAALLASAPAIMLHDTRSIYDPDRLRIFSAVWIYSVLGAGLGYFGDHADTRRKKIASRDMLLVLTEVMLTVCLLAVKYLNNSPRHIYIPFVGEKDIGMMYYPVAVIYSLAVIKAYYSMKNAQGIACAAAAAFSAGCVAVFSAVGMTLYAPAAAALAGSCTGFLKWNFPPEKTAVGGTGCLFAGFSAAALAIASGQLIIMLIMLLPALCYMLISPRLSGRGRIARLKARIYEHRGKSSAAYAVIIMFAAAAVFSAAGAGCLYFSEELFRNRIGS